MANITWANEQRRLSELIPWPRNPRQIRDTQVRRLQDSLEEFGQPEVIAIGPGNEVYNGHQRLKSWAAKFGDITVDVRVSSRALTEKEREKLTVFLHRGTTGEWDFDMLANEFEMSELVDWGFDPAELRIVDTPAGDDPGPQLDRAEELRQVWGVEVGQLWQLGEHRLICGDCRESATWERLTSGAKVNGVFTSPPYAEQRKEQYGGIPASEYVEWWDAAQSNVRANLAGDGSFFVNIKPHCENGERSLYVMDLVCAMSRRWSWLYVDEFCWLHEDLPGAWPNRLRNGFEPVHQFCTTASIRFFPRSVAKPSASVRNGRGGLSHREGGNWTLEAPLVSGMAQPSNVVRVGGNTDSVSHAAAFPVTLPEFFIRAYSNAGDVWVDPFCGSGTVIIAAHNTGRRGYGIELLPKYVAVALQRFYDMTGQTPVLVTDAGEVAR